MNAIDKLAQMISQKSAAEAMQTKFHVESDMKLKEWSADDMVIKGYASTFGGEPDAHGDVIVSGAFKKTLMQRSGRIKFLFGHDWNQIVGKVVHAEEDEKGLYIEAKIANTSLGKDLMALVDEGVVDRMSIGFTVKDYEWGDDGVFYIKEVDLYEVSAVGLPANDRAHIQKSFEAIKNDEEDVKLLIKDAITEIVGEEPKDDIVTSDIRKYLSKIKSLTAQEE